MRRHFARLTTDFSKDQFHAIKCCWRVQVNGTHLTTSPTYQLWLRYTEQNIRRCSLCILYLRQVCCSGHFQMLFSTRTVYFPVEHTRHSQLSRHDSAFARVFTNEMIKYANMSLDPCKWPDEQVVFDGLMRCTKYRNRWRLLAYTAYQNWNEMINGFRWPRRISANRFVSLSLIPICVHRTHQQNNSPIIEMKNLTQQQQQHQPPQFDLHEQHANSLCHHGR